MTKPKRPAGLVVLAVINFVFAAICMVSLAAVLFAGKLLAELGFTVTLYHVLSPLLTGTLLILTGIGLLRLNFWLGYLLGLVLAAGAIANIMVYNWMEGFQGLLFQIPSMVYPIVFFFLLTLVYRKYFTGELRGESAPDGA
jgi:hypothetical protein